MLDDLSVFFSLLVLALFAGAVWLLPRLRKLDRLEARVKDLESRQAEALRRLARLETWPSVPPSAPPAAAAKVADPVEPMPIPVVAPEPVSVVVPRVQDEPKPTPAPEPVPQTWTAGGTAPSTSARPAPRPKVVVAKEPDAFDNLRQYLSKWNPVVLGGSVLVLLGVIFLLGLAAQAGFFPPSLRLAGATALAGVLLVAGWKRRMTHPTWALPMQGTASAILFFVLYAAFHNLRLIPAGAAFAGAVMVLVSTGILAVLQSSQRLAVLAMVAGYAAPLVFSTGNGSHIGLFSYYAVLDLGVVAMVWARGWKTLLGIGFLATYGIATAWGVLKFSPVHFASCEAFLWIFYAMFSASAVGFALRGDGKRQGVVSGSLVFGLPLVTFSLQAKLVEGDKLLLAWTAAGMCLHHLLVGAWVLKQAAPDRKPVLKVMAETLLVLGSILGSLAIPLALSGRWTSLAWAVEGAGLVWLSARQGRVWNLLLGSVLLMAATVIHLDGSLNGVDATVLVVAILVAARCLDLSSIPLPVHGWIARAVVVVGWAIAVRATSGLAADWLATEDLERWMLAGTLCAALFSAVSQVGFAKWNGFHTSWIVAWFLWALLALRSGMNGDHALVHGWLAWGAGPLLAFWSLERARRDQAFFGVVGRSLESIFLHGTILVVCTEFARALQAPIWGDAAGWTLAALLLAGFTHPAVGKLPWFEARPGLHKGPWILPWVVVLAVHAFLTLTDRGGGSPLPWMPLLNSADLSALAFALAFLRLPNSVFLENANSPVRRRFVAVFLFSWISVTLFRGFHHYGGVGWSASGVIHSRPLQAVWSLVLTAQALGLCWFASRNAKRSLWFLGATLLGFVSLKLLLVDLSGSGSVARIVSFLGAGLLMVGIGYVSPIPPAKDPS